MIHVVNKHLNSCVCYNVVSINSRRLSDIQLGEESIVRENEFLTSSQNSTSLPMLHEDYCNL